MAQVPCSPTIIPNPTLFVSWPQYHFDTALTGCNPYESILSPATVGQLTLDWQVASVPGDPVVADGEIFAGGSGTLYAFNANTGAPVWAYQPDSAGSWGAAPAVANGVVYLAYDDLAGGLVSGMYAMDAFTGAVKWRNPNPSAAVSPTVANGMVYYNALATRA